MSGDSPLSAAIAGKCPKCGAKTLFAGWVRFADRCRACGLDFSSFNVGDGPAAFLILIVGAVVVAAALVLDAAAEPPWWVHLVWLPVAAAAAVLIGLGVWQLKRAVWKEQLLARFAAAEKLPPITWPTTPLKGDQLPLFRHATGVCLRPIGKWAIGGENRAGEPGYVQIIDCATGAEGPGMSVEVGWSANPNARVDWRGGPVSGIIVPDRRTRMRLVAATAPPGLEPSRTPTVESASPITPSGHRMYAATWFALALAALIVYSIVIAKRGRSGKT